MYCVRSVSYTTIPTIGFSVEEVATASQELDFHCLGYSCMDRTKYVQIDYYDSTEGLMYVVTLVVVDSSDRLVRHWTVS